MRRNPLKHTKLFVTLISVFILASSVNGNNIIKEDIINIKSINANLGSDVNANILEQLRKQYIIVKTEPIIPKSIIPIQIKPKENPIFVITAYDLSINSCSKSRGDVGFGITKNGTSLKNKTWPSTKVISVDPRIIPLNVKVKLTFIDAKHKKYSGNYKTVDTGSGIIGNRVDIFLGDFHSNRASKEAINFGIGYATVTILED